MNSEKEFITAADLEDRFASIMNASLSDMQENVAGEYVTIFNISEWVQIAFIRFVDNQDLVMIEVEVSLPSGTCGDSLGNSVDQINLLQGMMTHITYIEDLVKMGFTLSVIREACLWVASFIISDKPPSDVFDALVPQINK